MNQTGKTMSISVKFPACLKEFWPAGYPQTFGVRNLPMNKKYFDQLLPDNKKLLSLIENHIGGEVAIREVPMRNNLGCEIHNATILTPEGKFPDSSVLHELLHIRRVKVDGVPQLVVCDTFDFGDPNFETRITKLDNNIEHLFIVPEEINLRPNRITYWEDRINQAVETQKKSGLDVHVHGGDAILNWVFAHRILGHGCVVEKATKVIQELNCEETAKKLLSTLQQPNCNKGIFSRACLAELNLPSGSICLKYLDREENL